MFTWVAIQFSENIYFRKTGTNTMPEDCSDNGCPAKRQWIMPGVGFHWPFQRQMFEREFWILAHVDAWESHGRNKSFPKANLYSVSSLFAETSEFDKTHYHLYRNENTLLDWNRSYLECRVHEKGILNSAMPVSFVV